MSSVAQHFCVPAVYDDLEPSQTLSEAINALGILHETQERIFQQLENRLTTECSRLDGIRERVRIANDKVLSIARDRKKKATYVYSSPTYPIKSSDFIRLSGCDFVFGSSDYCDRVNVGASSVVSDADLDKRYTIAKSNFSNSEADEEKLNKSAGGSLYFNDVSIV